MISDGERLFMCLLAICMFLMTSFNKFEYDVSSLYLLIDWLCVRFI